MTGKLFRFFTISNWAMSAITMFLCAAMLATPNAAWAQSGASQSAVTLNIVIVEGDGAVNNIRQRVAREPIVRVEDENRKPIAGATVVFMLPGDGASGSFPGSQNMITVQTNQNGEAVARGLRPNNVAGDFSIRVTASFSGATATAVINQTNALAGAAAAGAGGAAAAGISAKVLAIIGVAAAVAVGGTYAATRGDNGGGTGPGTPGRTPTAISIGSPSVGAP
ncbi:MAG: carboxypeptidase-like regulatory domain-containing protein [Bryobacterales bacterium]|nr:carboxypeptidase-like regulatory domain-containing protein [Bryobacterales bacterium]